MLALGLASSASATGAATISRVSVASDGTGGNNESDGAAISADGRYIAFHSDADNLVPGDTNGASDVFLHDTTTGATTLISRHSEGSQGSYSSYGPAISADGRYIAYESEADNLVDGDFNGTWDVFLSDTATGTTTLVSPGHDVSYGPAISADGRYIAYSSLASNLVTGDTNGSEDVFVYDTTTATTTLISRHTDGTQGGGNSFGPAISADGRYIAYTSWADDLVSGDTNLWGDVFLHDTAHGTTTRVSLHTDGTQGNNVSQNPAISADGRYVTFETFAANLFSGDGNGTYDVLLRDTTTGVTTLISAHTDGTQGDDSSQNPAISADGRYVTYTSNATNLVTGEIFGWGNVFLHDTTTGTTSLISRHIEGDHVPTSSAPAISADGRAIAFTSDANNLVDSDTNDVTDIFLHVTPAAAPTPTATPGAALAETGADSSIFGALGLAALVAGAGILGLLAARRPRAN